MPDQDQTETMARRDRRRATFLALTLALQTVACVFFIADVAGDFRWIGADPHTTLEAMVAVALIVGTGFGALEMRRTLSRVQQAEVALFALKGLEVAEIARLRGTAPGTVRAQLNQVYAKSGSANRAQFVSLFIEELMAHSGLAPAA